MSIWTSINDALFGCPEQDDVAEAPAQAVAPSLLDVVAASGY